MTTPLPEKIDIFDKNGNAYGEANTIFLAKTINAILDFLTPTGEGKCNGDCSWKFPGGKFTPDSKCPLHKTPEGKLKIGDLRQWLNEDRITDPNKMVTSEEIETMLGCHTPHTEPERCYHCKQSRGHLISCPNSPFAEPEKKICEKCGKKIVKGNVDYTATVCCCPPQPVTEESWEKEFDAGCNTDNISDPPSDKEWIKEFIRKTLQSAIEEALQKQRREIYAGICKTTTEFADKIIKNAIESERARVRRVIEVMTPHPAVDLSGEFISKDFLLDHFDAISPTTTSNKETK